MLIALISSCNLQEKEQPLTLKLNSNDSNFRVQNGIIFHEQNLYTGYIFTLFQNQKDTSMIKGFLNGREHGTWKKIYPDGTLQEIRVYRNGKKVEKYNAYWENGTKKLAYSFKNDEYEGICEEWNSGGILIKSMHYSKGYEEGTQKMFFDDGKIRSNYVIVNGRRYGLLGTKNCINVSDSILKK
ncbi:MAG: toxin-antitoxin system YwqK family antitoxin [Pedobacter sp.]|nr:toxin-antitoxin system YwqK family antitoxin [Pedobacter sp.]